MRLECKHVWPLLSSYIDDSMSAEERRAIEEHLAHCEVCSAILDSLHNILVLTADDRVFHLPVGYSERLHARIRRELTTAAPGDSGGPGAAKGGDDGASDG